MKRRLALILLLSSTVLLTAARVDFPKCLADFKANAPASDTTDGRDDHGIPVTPIDATGLSYNACTRLCGSSPEPPSFTTISQQFSAWLLPWLALLSQLPYGSLEPKDDLWSCILTIGSPTLAAYSLAITVINGHWIAQRFQTIRPSHTTKKAVQVLTRLQQSPFKVVVGAPLISLVKLNRNHSWWSEMLRGLGMMHTWNIAARVSVLWVIIAYLFTVLDSFLPDITQALDASGQGIGSQFLFLLVLVVGWLQVEPKCDAASVDAAFVMTEEMLYVEEEKPTGGRVVKKIKNLSDNPFVLLRDPGWQHSLRKDEFNVPPVYNYARVLPWTVNVLRVFEAYRSVQVQEDAGEQATLLPLPRFNEKATDVWRSDVLWRIATASALALFLQWGTTGAALIVVMQTPTTGLGCRSLSFLIYAGVSTLIWFFMMISTFLTFKATKLYQHEQLPPLSSTQQFARITLKWSALIIRGSCKVAAALNGAGLLASCFLEFSNVFASCYCNSSVLHFGKEKAYNVIQMGSDARAAMTHSWIGGIVLGCSSAGFYLLYCALQLNPPMPKSRGR